VSVGREAVVKRAEELVREGKLDLAIAEYVRLTEDQPGDVGAANTLGDLYAKAGDRKRAVAQFSRIGDQQRESGFAAKAVAFYKKALKLDPGSDYALSRLAHVAASQGFHADATLYLNRLMQRRRDDGNEAGVAECLIQIGAFPSASPDVKIAAARAAAGHYAAARQAQLWIDAADALERNDRHREVVDALMQAVSHEAEDIALRRRLALACVRVGEPERARAFVSREVAGDHADLLILLAQIAASEGQDEQALQALRHALRVAPGRQSEIEGLLAPFAERVPDAVDEFVSSLPVEPAAAEEPWFARQETSDGDPYDWLTLTPEPGSEAEPDPAGAASVDVQTPAEATAEPVSEMSVEHLLADAEFVDFALIDEPAADEASAVDEATGQAAAGAAYAPDAAEPSDVPVVAAPVSWVLETNTVGESMVLTDAPAVSEAEAPSAAFVEPAEVVRGGVDEQVADDDVLDDRTTDDRTTTEPDAFLIDASAAAGASEEFELDFDFIDVLDDAPPAAAEAVAGDDVVETDPVEVDVVETDIVETDVVESDIVVEAWESAPPIDAETLETAAEAAATPPVPDAAAASLDDVFDELFAEIDLDIDADLPEEAAPAPGVGAMPEEGSPTPEGAAAAGDTDATMADLHAAADNPALAFQASAQLGRHYRRLGRLGEAITWFDRSAQAVAPVREQRLDVLYELADVLEEAGQRRRALDVFADLELDAASYRDVAGRMARLRLALEEERAT
jgi:tetratricopeptide (TPR) repeat protein